MLVLFTDFGWGGPYVGQMKAVLCRDAPRVPVVDLMHDAPAFDPEAAAYLLAAFVETLPADCVVVGVVDPGVGGPREAVMVHAGRRWFVGPENGLFNTVALQARDARWWRLDWRPASLSASFHGRDLFAPAAARLASGTAPERLGSPLASPVPSAWAADRAAIVYIDGYGNAMTGLRAAAVPADASLEVSGLRLVSAATFSAVAAGQPFWYANSSGLVEIAVNQGRADRLPGVACGAAVRVARPSPDQAADGR